MVSYEEEKGENLQEDNDYELLPHEELEKLRKEVEAVKRNPLGKYHDSEDLIGSMNQLTDSINKLLKLFSSVKTSMIEDFTKHSLHDHFSQISSQNEKIAQGIVAVAKMLKNQQEGNGQDTTPQGAIGQQNSAFQGAVNGLQSSVPEGHGSSRQYPQGLNAQGMPQPGMGNQQNQGKANQSPAQSGYGNDAQGSVPQGTRISSPAQNQGLGSDVQDSAPQGSGIPPPPNQNQGAARSGPASQNSAPSGYGNDADSHMDLPPPPPSTHEKKKKSGLFRK
ncbi:MAG: hypothetical protein ACQESE_01790 [Nanobdellota archaeon]